MFKFRNHYRPLLMLFLILALSVPSFSQEATDPTEVPVVPTEVAPIVTEEATPVEVIDPTEVIPPTVEAAPTEEIIPSEAPTLEASEEAPVDSTPETPVDVTLEATLDAPIPTAEPQSNNTVAPTGNAVEMLLHYSVGASEESIQEMLRSLGAVELERIPQLGVIRAMIPSSVSNVSSALSTLQGNGLASSAGLMAIEPNTVWQIDFTPNDPYFIGGLQPNMEDSDGSDYSIFMERAWGISVRDGLGVTVAVIDTGVDLQHPEFAGKLVAGWDFYNDDPIPDDDQGHGTHVAGVIAAKTNNLIGMAGVAYNSTIMPLKVCGSMGCPTFEIGAAIIFAADRNVRVINMSLGGSVDSTTIRGAVNYAISRNVVVVAAAGNGGDNTGDNVTQGTSTDEISFPASYPGVISVASADYNQDISIFSNTNNMITVAAPGDYILSTWPLTNPYTGAPFPEAGGGWPIGDRPAVGYEYIGGTSMAAPHVAGLAALLIADGIATTPATVREAITCSALDLGDNDYDNAFGYGLIQADWALTWTNELAPDLPNSPLCQFTQPNDYIHNATTITTPPFAITQAMNTRSVTASDSDPQIGLVDADQTLWYKFTPLTSGLFLFSTLGSGNLDTLLGVYEGQPAALREIANGNAIGSDHAVLSVNLTRGITYYIQLGTTGGPYADQFVQLTVNPALTLATLQQETATFLRYTGTWSRVLATGSSGGYVNTTTDPNATVSFLARGTTLKLTRLVGPTQANMIVLVDGVPCETVYNLGAVTRSMTEEVDLGSTTGQWHVVTIQHAGGLAPISIDAIQVLDGALPIGLVGATRLNETTIAFTNAFHDGNWFSSTGNALALLGDLKYTDDAGAYVEFRATGSAITFFRMTDPTTTGVMQIYIDGVPYATVDNTDFPANNSVPYSIANLTPRERVIRIEHVGPGRFAFDGAVSPLQAILAPNLITDERAPSIVYTGIWAKVAATALAANAATLSNISDTSGGGKAEFMFNGNHLCVGYQEGAGSRSMDILIDGVPVGTINSAGALNKIEWCTYNNNVNLLADGLHSVSLVVAAGNNFNLDYVRPVRRMVFTSSMGYITEANPGIIYNNSFGIWIATIQKSVGGASFQGGGARRADVSPNPAPGNEPRLSFTINGTGFIIYTSINPASTAGAYIIYVDGSGTPMDFSHDNQTNPFIDLWDGEWRFRPVGIGIVDLPLGIHHIELRADNPFNGSLAFVDFDGIRVLP